MDFYDYNPSLMSLEFSQITLSNLTFNAASTMVLFPSALRHPCKITNSTFYFISGGRLRFERIIDPTNNVGPLKVEMDHILVKEVSHGSISPILVLHETNLVITNSEFINCENKGYGGVFQIVSMSAFVNISGSSFVKNESPHGGVFGMKGGTVFCYNSTLEQNVAHLGAIAKILDEGNIQMFDSIVKNNQAIEGIFIHLEQSSIPFVFSNITFESNSQYRRRSRLAATSTFEYSSPVLFYVQ